MMVMTEETRQRALAAAEHARLVRLAAARAPRPGSLFVAALVALATRLPASPGATQARPQTVR